VLEFRWIGSAFAQKTTNLRESILPYRERLMSYLQAWGLGR